MSFLTKVNEFNAIRYFNNTPIIVDAEQQLRTLQGTGADRYFLNSDPFR